MKCTYLLFVLVFLVLLIIFLIFLIALVIFVLAVVLYVGGCLFLPLHSTLCQLLHHLQELLAVVLEQVVGNSKYPSGPCSYQRFTTKAGHTHH